MTKGVGSQAPVGEWMLKSARFEFEDDGRSMDIYGPDPTGRVIITEAGRLTAILTAADRAAPASAADNSAPFSSMMVYSGDYIVQGDKLVTKVDLAQHPTWVGTEQARFFQVDGDELSLWSAPMGHPGFGGRVGRSTFKWARAS